MHNIGMNGHVGHARNMSCSINMYDQANKEKLRNAGWGLDVENLKQPKDVRCLPMDQQYHKRFWDYDVLTYQLKTTGLFSEHVDQ